MQDGSESYGPTANMYDLAVEVSNSGFFFRGAVELLRRRDEGSDDRRPKLTSFMTWGSLPNDTAMIQEVPSNCHLTRLRDR